MKKKNEFPKKLFVVLDIDSDGATPIAFETSDDISEHVAGQQIGIYQLVDTGTFSIEKKIDTKRHATVNDRILADASHEEMVSYVRKVGLKLHTKNMSTRDLRKHLREYLSHKNR